MKIKDKLIEPYEIHYDGVQYTIGIPKIDKKGVENLTGASYYTSLSSAILKGINLKLGSQDKVLTLKEYIDLYNNIKEELINNIKL